MLDSKLFQLLSSVKKNKGEIGDFEKFIRSPYFNSKQYLVGIVVYIKKNWHEKNEARLAEKLDKEKVFFSAFPEEKEYNARKMNDCLHYLSLLLEKYFAVKEMQGRPNKEKHYLANALKRRGLDKYYFKAAETLKTELREKKETAAALGAVVYWDLSRVNEQIYYHPSTVAHSQKENDELLADAIENLDTAYIIKKLQFCCEVYARNKIYGQKAAPALLDELLEIAHGKYSDHPLIMAYVGLVELFRSEDVGKVEEVKQKVLALAKLDYLDCRLDLVAQLINALPAVPNRLALYFELYKCAVDCGFILEDDFISQANFNNIIHIGCSSNNLEWTTDFMEKFLPHLDDSMEKRDNIRQLSMAFFDYCRGDYPGAYLHLQTKLKLKDTSYGMRYHLLLLQILAADHQHGGQLYRITDFREKVKAFRRYLSTRHKIGHISTPVYEANKNFAEILPKIYYWKFHRSTKEALLKKMAGYEEVSFRAWLRHMINRL